MTNFSVYVAHRVNKILRSSSIQDWFYVPTKLNAADDLTSHAGFRTLTNQSQWFTGPEIILQTKIESVRLNLIKTASITFDKRINDSVQLESNVDKIKNKEQDHSL